MVSLGAFSVCARIQKQFLDFLIRCLAEHLVPMANRIKGVWLDDDDEFIHRLLQFLRGIPLAQPGQRPRFAPVVVPATQ